MAGWYGRCVFNLLKKLPNCFPKYLSHFAFPPSLYDRVLVAQHPWWHLELEWSVFNFSCPFGCEEMKFTFLTCNLHALMKSISSCVHWPFCIFCEMSIKIFCRFLIGLSYWVLRVFFNIYSVIQVSCLIYVLWIYSPSPWLCLFVFLKRCQYHLVKSGAYGVSRDKKDIEYLTNVTNLKNSVES